MGFQSVWDGGLCGIFVGDVAGDAARANSVRMAATAVSLSFFRLII